MPARTTYRIFPRTVPKVTWEDLLPEHRYEPWDLWMQLLLGAILLSTLPWVAPDLGTGLWKLSFKFLFTMMASWLVLVLNLAWYRFCSLWKRGAHRQWRLQFQENFAARSFTKDANKQFDRLERHRRMASHRLEQLKRTLRKTEDCFSVNRYLDFRRNYRAFSLAHQRILNRRQRFYVEQDQLYDILETSKDEKEGRKGRENSFPKLLPTFPEQTLTEIEERFAELMEEVDRNYEFASIVGSLADGDPKLDPDRILGGTILTYRGIEN